MVHVRQAGLSKILKQSVGTLSRFSVGISVSSPEGQKEIILALGLLARRDGSVSRWAATK
jgi:hypothetical protein